MSLRNFAYGFLLVCMTLTIAGAASGHHHEFGAAGGRLTDQAIDRSVQTLQQSLNLNASQADSVKQLVKSRRESFQSIREQTRPKYQQLMTMLKQPNPDPAAVGRATIELKTIHDQAVAKQADADKQFMSLLNPTQQQTVNNIRGQAGTFEALHRLRLLGPHEHDTLMSSLYEGE